jgi:hypothetical protein
MRRIAAAGITIVLLLGVTALAACGGGGDKTSGAKASGPAGRQYVYKSGGNRDVTEAILMVENDGRWALVDWSQYGGVIGGQWQDKGDHLEFTQPGVTTATARFAADAMTLTFDAGESALGGTVWSASGEPAMKGDEAVGVYGISGGTGADAYPECTISLYEDGSWMIWGKTMPEDPQPMVVWGGKWTRNGSDILLDTVGGQGSHVDYADRCTLEGDTLRMSWEGDAGEKTAIWTRQ